MSETSKSSPFAEAVSLGASPKAAAPTAPSQPPAASVKVQAAAWLESTL